MNFYLEAMKNDIEIASMDCDITLDRAELISDYYTDMSNIYSESVSDNEEWFTEAGNKITEGIKKAIDAVIEFINKCVDKIKEMMTKQKIKKLQDKYEEAVRKDPSLKNKKIKYYDLTEKNNARQKLVNKLNNNNNDLDKDSIENEKEKISKIKPVVKTVLIGSAFVLLTSLSAAMYKTAKDSINTLNDQKQKLDTELAKAKKYSEELENERTKLYKSELDMGKQIRDWEPHMSKTPWRKYDDEIKKHMDRSNKLINKNHEAYDPRVEGQNGRSHV